jgi:hypothetical protein
MTILCIPIDVQMELAKLQNTMDMKLDENESPLQ